MRMTEESIERFNSTVHGFSKEYGINVIADHVESTQVTMMTFVHPREKTTYYRYVFKWGEVTSITAGLTNIFVDALRWVEARDTFNQGLDKYHKLLETNAYIRNDISTTEEAARRMPKVSGIKKVHFSGPVTCVIWADGTKTLVRCSENDMYDYEKGLAMAIAKKALGTNASGSNYYDIFKEWLPSEEEAEIEVPTIAPFSDEMVKEICNTINKLFIPMV